MPPLRGKKLRVLYSDPSPASIQAKKILRDVNIDFQEIFIEDPSKERPWQEFIIPQLLTFQGFFEGLDNIMKFILKLYGTEEMIKNADKLKQIMELLNH